MIVAAPVVNVPPLVAVYLMIASVPPTFSQPPGVVALAFKLILPTLVIVPVVVKSTPPISSFRVVAELNTVGVTIFMKLTKAPAGKTIPVEPVSDDSKLLNVRLAVWDTTVAPKFSIVPAVVPVVFLTVPKSQGPR
jgi:hypothetical protein